MDIEQAKAELREHYGRMRDAIMGAIAGLSEAQMSEPSLDGWSVKDHLAHLAAWDEVRSLEIARISDGLGPAWPAWMGGENVEVFNDLTVRMRREWSVEETVASVHWALGRVLASIAAAGERAFDESLYGESGLRSSHAVEHAGLIRRWRTSAGV